MDAKRDGTNAKASKKSPKHACARTGMSDAAGDSFVNNIVLARRERRFGREEGK